MEASDTRLGSYAWKSILIGRDVIQRGSRWRVGNGEKINIWQHRWLPRKHPPQLPTCPIDDFEHSLASCLIDPNTRQWQTDIMDGLFVEADAEIIKKIPLSQLATDDVLYWPFSSNGDYSCKSGYRFLKDEAEQLDTNRVPPLKDKNLWKAIWSMCVPQKVKNFLWRTCHNAIPTKQALMKRTIISDPTSERCRVDIKDPLHALWSCSEVDIVWADLTLWDFRSVRLNFINHLVGFIPCQICLYFSN